MGEEKQKIELKEDHRYLFRGKSYPSYVEIIEYHVLEIVDRYVKMYNPITKNIFWIEKNDQFFQRMEVVYWLGKIPKQEKPTWIPTTSIPHTET